MKRVICSILAMAILAGSVGQAVADIIHLKTSRRLIGEMVGEDKESIHFKLKDEDYSLQVPAEKIKKSEIFAVTNSIGLVIWPEEFKGKVRIWKPIPDMSAIEYQNYLTERDIEQQKILNNTVGHIRTTMIVGLVLAIGIGILAASAN